MMNFNRYFFFILILFIPFSFVFGQEEKSLSEFQKETDTKKRFLKEYAYVQLLTKKNLFKADSLKISLIDNSYMMPSVWQFRAIALACEIDLLTGNTAAFKSHISGIETYRESLQEKEDLFLFYKLLGKSSSLNSDQTSTLFYYGKAEKVAKEMRNNAKVSLMNIHFADFFIFQNQKDSAVYYSNLALKYARRTNNKLATAYCFNTQAFIYSYFGQFELAVAKNIIGLEIANKFNDLYLISKINREIGEAQRKILNFDDALDYFNQSLSHAMRLSDYRQVGLSYSNIGMVYYDKKDLPKALNYLKKGQYYLSKLDDLNALGELFSNLGLVQVELKRYAVALNDFNQALVYYESSGNKLRIAEVYYNVGNVFLKQKKYQNAINYLQKSLKISEGFGTKNQVFSTYKILANVYKDLGNLKQSYFYLEKYLYYLDSNSTLQAATKIAELSESYRYDQREKLIQSQADSINKQRQEKLISSKTIENAELKNEFQRYVILGFFILLLFAGIIVFYRFNQIEIKRRQKEAEMSQTLLRTQMNPHFVFNAMSVIQSYIYENDTENSTRFLVNFSRLMRLILENSPKEFIPITTEVEILEKYLSMQKLRFENRFEYTLEVEAELFSEGASIPPMITQPFIENAIEHGQLHTIQEGFIKVHFYKKNNQLKIDIIDNGIGRKVAEMNKKSKAHKSMAMKITKDRIDNLNKKYKTEGFLKIEDFNKTLEVGTKILISLPYKYETH